MKRGRLADRASRLRRPLGLAGVLLAFPLGAALVLTEPELTTRADHAVADWTMRQRPGPAPPTALTVVGYNRTPTRGEMARLVRRLDQAGTRVIGIGLKFVAAKDRSGSARLRDAIRDHGRVVLSVGEYRVFGRDRHIPVLFGGPRSERPAGAGTGGAGYREDADGVVRAINPKIAIVDGRTGQRVPATEESVAPNSFAQAVARAASKGGELPSGKSAKNRVVINFRSPENRFEVVPMRAITSGSVNSQDLSGQVVLIGPTAKASGYAIRTPVARHMGAVEVDANAVATLLEVPRLGPPAKPPQLGLVALTALLPLVLLGPWPRWLPGLLSGPRSELLSRLLAVPAVVAAFIWGQGTPSIDEVMYWPWTAMIITGVFSSFAAMLLRARRSPPFRRAGPLRVGSARPNSTSTAVRGKRRWMPH